MAAGAPVAGRILLPVLGALLMFSTAGTALAAALPDIPLYNRDIRPILADACFRCHGFDKNTRKADRRLDTLAGAAADKDGKRAIVPSHPEQSDLMARLAETDPDEVMPPPGETRQLSSDEKELLKRWIAQGAKYEDHWAYIPPVPPVKKGWSGLEVDQFIDSRLASLNLEPAPPASRAVLVRRLSFDLTGLPPSAEVVDAFLQNPSPGAPRDLVDRLLETEAFGERMAVWWLDQTRYADTIGYHSDNPRQVTPWRDYVIRSFNENKPFDRFTVEQIAGDLLPAKTQETTVASAYNRLILSTEEGGAQPGQYIAKYLTDRVKSIGTTWLGQTLMCCECHDHKYDPVTARDFYSLGAFFADIDEVAVGSRGQGVPVFSKPALKEHGDLVERISAMETDLASPHPELASPQAAWETQTGELIALAGQWRPLTYAKFEAIKSLSVDQSEDAAIHALTDPKTEGTTYRLAINQLTGPVGAFRLEALPLDTLPARGPGLSPNGNFVLTEFTATIRRANGAEEPFRFSEAHADFEQKSQNDNPWKGWPAAAVIDGDAKGKQWGWAILPETGKPHQLTLTAARALTLSEGDELIIELQQNHDGNHRLGNFRLSYATAPESGQAVRKLPDPAIVSLLRVPVSEQTEAQRSQLAAHYRQTGPELAALRHDLDTARQRRDTLQAEARKCLVTNALNSPRTVRILPRGDWQNESGPEVLPATPKFLPGYIESTPDHRLNRLDLARWLVSPQNPLTARVFVNRLWKLFYGTGLVKSLDDLGTQSEWPAHQALLDWLACQFMDSGWDVKHMIRLMVNTNAYRRSSAATGDALASDPHNREMARGGRWRLDAEFVRDNALSISGLLVKHTGGPSVHPYQPAGYWENLNFPGRDWPVSQNENQWRRGLYTWWQRSYVHPAMLAFDAPTREECAADRTRSNIPQQALVLLNDPQFVEAARAFAARILRQAPASDPERIAWAWREATGRPPLQEESATLLTLLNHHRSHFGGHPDEAKALLQTGQSPLPGDANPPELAALTSVCRTLLNLHETITRP